MDSSTNNANAFPLVVAANYIGISKPTIYRLINKGSLQAKKIGGRTVVLRAELDRFLQSAPDAVESGAIRKVA